MRMKFNFPSTLIILQWLSLFMNITTKSFSKEKIKEKLLKHAVIPDVIDVAPKYSIKVHWLHGVSAEFGNTLVPEDLRLSPFLVKWPFKKGEMYTLIMIDPDAPSPKKHTLREWKHWILGNMPGPLMLTYDTVAEYIGPDPLKKTGLHRYIFLIFKQQGNITFKDCIHSVERKDDLRGHFSTRKFAIDYKLGDPIAVNFFLAEWKENSTTGDEEYSYDAFKIHEDMPPLPFSDRLNE